MSAKPPGQRSIAQGLSKIGAVGVVFGCIAAGAALLIIARLGDGDPNRFLDLLAIGFFMGALSAIYFLVFDLSEHGK
ncbi:MAG: hypothetical protein AAF747_10865 [Planctomycetota bacterium]